MKNHYYLLCLLLTCGAGCKNHQFRAIDSRGHSVGYVSNECVTGEVDVGFDNAGWCFSWEMRGSGGFPVEAFLALYAKRGGQVVSIEKPSDMKKLDGIRIRSADEAQRFVRLFTGGDTYYRFVDPLAFEFPHGKVKATKTGESFVIIRQLLFPRERPEFNLKTSIGNKFPVYEVKETVSSNGRYVCEKLRITDWVEEQDLNILRIQ